MFDDDVCKLHAKAVLMLPDIAVPPDPNRNHSSQAPLCIFATRVVVELRPPELRTTMRRRN